MNQIIRPKTIAEGHKELWLATVETHQLSLRYAFPIDEAKQKAMVDAAQKVVDAIDAYLALVGKGGR